LGSTRPSCRASKTSRLTQTGVRLVMLRGAATVLRYGLL
jgi:hypothetical protein